MKQKFLVLALLSLLLLAAAAVMAQDEEPRREIQPTAPESAAIAGDCEAISGPNLLQNASFEGEYSAYVPPWNHPDCPSGVCNTAQMADGWTPYWRSHDPNDPPDDTVMPEYKPATVGVSGPVRVHSGERAQQYFSFSATHEAGFYQKVNVTPGASYCYSIWGHSWSSSNDDPWTSNLPLEQRIGVHPTGGIDWLSSDMVWGPPVQQYTEYAQLSIKVTAQSSQMTVLTWSRPIWPAKHNDVYWDDAVLKEIDEQPELAVPSNGAVFLVDKDVPTVERRQLLIDLSGFADVAWTATLEPGNSFSPSISPTSGNGSHLLTIEVDTSQYSPGDYTAELTISTDPTVPGSPVTIPLNLHIVDEIYDNYLPQLLTP